MKGIRVYENEEIKYSFIYIHLITIVFKIWIVNLFDKGFYHADNTLIRSKTYYNSFIKGFCLTHSSPEPKS